ncbi:MAG TPA: 4'-phosphopantetheinyl transferase superfamily protein, partial [Bacteroidales bacterium]|nr:4'-phosphopantetheinyl transferase superfamily protein [Bacteroidales bacterium]
DVQEHEEWKKEENLEKAVAYWTFKEAIVKAYGKRYITLRGNIHIDPFVLEKAKANGFIRLKSKQFPFDLHLRQYQNMMISVAHEPE